MKQSDQGSFTVPEIRKLLRVAKSTAYEISKLPEMDRKLVAGEYRIPKVNFWKWYRTQKHYRIFDDDAALADYFSSRDIADMFGWDVTSASTFLKRKGLVEDISEFRNYTRKEIFIDWYIHQYRYSSSEKKKKKKEVTPAYDIHDVQKMLGTKPNSTIYRLYRREHLDVIRIEGLILVVKESFDNWFLNQTEYPRKENHHGIDR